MVYCPYFGSPVLFQSLCHTKAGYHEHLVASSHEKGAITKQGAGPLTAPQKLLLRAASFCAGPHLSGLCCATLLHAHQHAKFPIAPHCCCGFPLHLDLRRPPHQRQEHLTAKTNHAEGQMKRIPAFSEELQARSIFDSGHLRKLPKQGQANFTGHRFHCVRRMPQELLVGIISPDAARG